MTADIDAWADSGLQYELDGNVAWLRLDRPDKRNAIDRPLRNALLAAIHEVTEDRAVRAAVITGNGVAFSSGADLTQVDGPMEIPEDRRRSEPNVIRDDGLLYGWARLVDAIWRSEKVFIAAVNGLAAGGGCQLALGCDLVIASEAATFWEIFVKRGIPLEAGGAWILTRATSLVRAKELALFGEPLSAGDAERWGLVNRVVPADHLEATAREWANRLAGGPTITIGHIKGQLNSALQSTRDLMFRDEATLLALAMSEDAVEARTAYMERREPRYTGR